MQALEVSKRLRKRSHQVWLACLPGSRLHREAEAINLPTLPLKVRGYFHPIVIRNLVRFLRKKSIHIIHCQHSKDIATVVPAKIFAGTQVPIILHKRVGSYIQKRDLFHRFTYAHIDRVLAISSVIHRNVIETTPIKPERVETLHDAIDTNAFSLAKVDRNATRRGFGFTPEMVIVGMVGRFSPGKGHEEFLQAAALLMGKHPMMKFVIVGEASFGEKEYYEHIRKLCSELRLNDAVLFAGFRKDVAAVMASFDIFAFPSHAEAFGMVLIEAMAMERAVVATNCDGVLDIVVDGVTGLSVNPKKPDELAAAIERLSCDSQLLETMGKNGRRRVLEMFDTEKQTQRIEEIYRQLMNNK